MLSFTPTEKPRQIETFEQWQRAFEIFQAVVLTHPVHCSEAAGLLKYGQTIRELYQSHADWCGYDEAFRALKKQMGWDWGMIPSELWMKAMSRITNSEKRPFLGQGQKKGGGDRSRQRHCFKFNKGESHDEKSCQYPHICRYCYKRGHAGPSCWQKWGKPADAKTGPSKPAPKA